MKLKVEIAESVESLWHHKLRTSLTLLGMIFGVGAVIAMLSIGKGAEQEALQLIDAMGLRNLIVKTRVFEESRLKEMRESSPGLTLMDLNAARETLPFLSTYSAGKQVKVFALFRKTMESDAEVWGVTPTHARMAGLGIHAGRFLLPVDDVAFAHVCVIGSRVAQVLFPGEDPIGQHLKVNHVWLTVVGVLRDKNLTKNEFQGITLKGEQNNVYLPLSTALKMFRFGPNEPEIDEFRVQLQPGIPSGAAAATLSQLLARHHKEVNDYELIVPEALYEQQKKTQNIFTIVMACIAGISLLVGDGAGADPGDRPAAGPGRPGGRHPAAVHRRDLHHLGAGRVGGDLLRLRPLLPALAGHRLADRLERPGDPALLRRLRHHRAGVRHLSGPPGLAAQPDRGPAPRLKSGPGPNGLRWCGSRPRRGPGRPRAPLRPHPLPGPGRSAAQSPSSSRAQARDQGSSGWRRANSPRPDSVSA